MAGEAATRAGAVWEAASAEEVTAEEWGAAKVVNRVVVAVAQAATRVVVVTAPRRLYGPRSRC